MILMSTTEIVSIAIAIITSMGAIATAAYAFSDKSRSIKNDVINTYEKRVKQLENDMDVVLKKLDEVKSILEKRETELKTVTEILQGRNPQMDGFINLLTQAAKENAPFRARTTMMLESLMHHYALPIPPLMPAN